MKNNQNKQNNNAKNCGSKNCGSKNCGNNKNSQKGQNHSYEHGGNND